MSRDVSICSHTYMRATLLLALACAACAVQTVDDSQTDDSVADQPTVYYSETGGGKDCTTPTYFVLSSGEIIYEPGLCTIPSLWPEPDPVKGSVPKMNEELINPELDVTVEHSLD